MSLSWIPIGILENIHKLSPQFLWEGSHDQCVMLWVKYERIGVPKSWGGCGLKNIMLFTKSLVVNVGWRLLTTRWYI